VVLAQLDRHAERAHDLGALGYLRKQDVAGELIACLRSAARDVPYVATALRPARAPVVDPRIEELSADERRVLGLLGQHKSSHQIGEVMAVDHRVVQNHCASASGKLGLRGHQALLAFAVAHRHQL
jgi:two-component system response regulator DevR